MAWAALWALGVSAPAETFYAALRPPARPVAWSENRVLADLPLPAGLSAVALPAPAEGRGGGDYDFQGCGDGRRSIFAFSMPDLNSTDRKSQPADLMPLLKNIFQSEGLPPHLAWLAEVESALDPQAESRSGALGLFQLMPDTARRFGLKIFPDDDRRAPVKNARAAAAYLRWLRNEFGCWSLALAAYNAGEGRVNRTMKLYRVKTFHELAPYLPAETRQYVPRVMLTIALREDQMRGKPAARWLR